MAVTYSTSEVPPLKCVDYWREVVTKELARHEFHSGVGANFSATLRMGLLGALGFAQFKFDPCAIDRTPRDVACCPNEDFILTLQLAGQSVFLQDGREALMERGSLALFDLRRPWGAIHHTPVECIGMSIPRQALTSRLGNAAALTARAMPADKPVAGLASGFLNLLSDRLDALEGPTGSGVAEQAMDLLALAFSAETSQNGVTLSSSRASTLLRLKSVIEGRLWEPAFKPAAAAAQAGISIRYANALLSQEGFSMERFILFRRLERCRRALEDPAQAHRTIGEIAFGWGFSDLSHFGRRFRAEYGFTPGDYRRRTLEVSYLRGSEAVLEGTGTAK